MPASSANRATRAAISASECARTADGHWTRRNGNKAPCHSPGRGGWRGASGLVKGLVGMPTHHPWAHPGSCRFVMPLGLTCSKNDDWEWWGPPVERKVLSSRLLGGEAPLPPPRSDPMQAVGGRNKPGTIARQLGIAPAAIGCSAGPANCGARRCSSVAMRLCASSACT